MDETIDDVLFELRKIYAETVRVETESNIASFARDNPKRHSDTVMRCIEVIKQKFDR